MAISDDDKNLHYPNDLRNGTEGHWVEFTAYPSLFGGKTSTTSDFTVALPMSAQALISTAEAIYAEQEGLGTVLSETAERVAGTLEPWFTTGDTGRKGNVSTILSGITEGMNQATGESVAEHGVAQMIRKNDFLKRAVGGLNVAVNPKMSLLYQGPGKFRKFTFEFPMIAKDPAESEMIQAIIKRFRMATLPGYTDSHIANVQTSTGSKAKRGAGSNFFAFPSKFIIQFGHAGGGGGASLQGSGTPFKIAQSVCNACVINYAAAGIPFFFEDNHPFEVKMTLTFTETIIMTKEMVKEGY